jgi:glucan 1,6-alpha-glucosidase
VYQIYPRSFQDSNGDGIGDLQGIIGRLEYLAELGVDAVWLSPVCRSPQDDNGYDISDYQDIDPIFGTMAQMKTLFAEARKRGIRILIDLVLNHTSDEHPWFLEAKKGRENPFHDYYVWRNGAEGTPPNDMVSTFGGPAWQWCPEIGQYYFHQFSVRQPDLNWDNPAVRRALCKMVNWWIEQGAGGFRMDVIDQIAKEPDLKITSNGPNLQKYIRELSREVFQGRDLLTVGEAWGATTELAKLYSNPDGSEFSMVFQFEHCFLDQKPGASKWDLQPLDFIGLKRVFAKWQVELYQKGWNSLFWNNHDLPRIVSRWGNDGKYRAESAKMLATVLHGMQGTPFIYQGEELGMTNVQFDISEYRDIETLNLYRDRTEKGIPAQEVMRSIHAKGRDNARTPMQWDGSSNAGFTSGNPWIGINPNNTFINAEEQRKNPDSIYHYYRKLIRLRKEYKVFADGKFELLYEDDKELFAYTRKTNREALLVLCNFFGSTRSVQVPLHRQLLLCNYTAIPDRNILRPYEARIYLL